MFNSMQNVWGHDPSQGVNKSITGVVDRVAGDVVVLAPTPSTMQPCVPHAHHYPVVQRQGARSHCSDNHAE